VLRPAGQHACGCGDRQGPDAAAGSRRVAAHQRAQRVRQEHAACVLGWRVARRRRRVFGGQSPQPRRQHCSSSRRSSSRACSQAGSDVPATAAARGARGQLQGAAVLSCIA
jgi:hypothetical protein